MDKKTLIIIVAVAISIIIVITVVALLFILRKPATQSSSNSKTSNATASGDFASFNVGGTYAIISISPQPTDVYATVTIIDNGKTIDIKLNNINGVPISNMTAVPVTTRTNLTFVANNANNTVSYSTNSGNNGALTLTGVIMPLSTTYTFAILRV
jgi:hypothetical protein